MPITSCVQIGVENVVVYFVLLLCVVCCRVNEEVVTPDIRGSSGATWANRRHPPNVNRSRTAIPGLRVTLYLITSPFRKLVRDVDGDD